MPISIHRLRELIDLAGSGGVESIDMIEDGTHILIMRAGNAPMRRVDAALARPAPPQPPSPPGNELLSPMFGIFHLTPAPGAKPFVSPGLRVVKGQQLCLIEAMKMFNAFHADRDGQLDAILAEAGSEITKGQPLFRIVEG